MNESLQNKIVEWVQTFGDIASTEIPAFVKECAMYGSISNGVIFIFLISICLYIYYHLKYHVIEYNIYHLDYDAQLGITIFSYIAIFLILLFSLVPLEKSIQALFAPRLYVIERFTK